MMLNCNIPRSMLQGRKILSNSLNIQCSKAIRTISVAAATEKYEDPALANAKPYNEMPKLPMLPIIGSSWVYFPIIGRYSVEALHKADEHKFKVYGPVVREKFGNVEMVSSFEAETMKMLFQHEGQYPSRGELETLVAYRDSRKHWYRSGGVLVTEGKEWYDIRSKVQKHLMKPKAIQAYLNPMQDVARDMISHMRLKRDANKEVPNLLEEMYKWALESVGYVGLDSRFNCLDPNLAPDSDGFRVIKSAQTMFDSMNKLETTSGNFPFWKYFRTPTWKKYEEASDVFTEIAYKCINRSLDNLKKRENEDADLTLLQCMLMSKEMDISEAMVMVADMLFAGVDTTSNTVAFLLYNLAKNPDKQEKLFKEIHDVLPRKEDRITPEIFNQFHYLKACMKENQRLTPIVRGVPRILDHDVVVSGYRVPAGTVILSVHPIVSRQEKYFKNANQFIPERWLDKNLKPEYPFAFVPFGIGTRSCLGRRLAELEIICLSIEIIRNFKVEYHHEDIGMVTRLVTVPDRPLRFSFLDR